MKQEFRFTFDRYESIDSLPEADRCLATAAEKATENSFAPYSRFRVGAAARLASGRIVTGANIESEVFPSGSAPNARCSTTVRPTTPTTP